jgi:hypothetical protein
VKRKERIQVGLRNFVRNQSNLAASEPEGEDAVFDLGLKSSDEEEEEEEENGEAGIPVPFEGVLIGCRLG